MKLDNGMGSCSLRRNGGCNLFHQSTHAHPNSSTSLIFGARWYGRDPFRPLEVQAFHSWGRSLEGNVPFIKHQNRRGCIQRIYLTFELRGSSTVSHPSIQAFQSSPNFKLIMYCFARSIHSLFGFADVAAAGSLLEPISFIFSSRVLQRYGLLHYAYLIRRTGPVIFLSCYLI